jgi:hypothetical protein
MIYEALLKAVQDIINEYVPDDSQKEARRSLDQYVWMLDKELDAQAEKSEQKRRIQA